jgi:hypothetical protein
MPRVRAAGVNATHPGSHGALARPSEERIRRSGSVRLSMRTMDTIDRPAKRGGRGWTTSGRTRRSLIRTSAP